MSLQSFSTTRGLLYSYIYHPSQSNPTLLFLHGFPSHLAEWNSQISYFQSLGYGIVAVDLLGFGHSSKPEGGESYRFKLMAQDLVELLDKLELAQVVGIGHDLGANFLGKLAAYYPNRIPALIFLTVGSGRLGQKFDIDMIHRMTKQHLGFEMFGYISWLGDSTNPHRTLEQHAKSAMSLLYSDQPDAWNKWFHPLGKFQEFVSQDRTVQLGNWYSPQLQEQHLAIYGVEDGYKGATRWYQMMVDNLSTQDEAGMEQVKLHQPTLFVGQGPESGQQIQMLSEWVPNLTTVNISSGHWVHLEQADETNKFIQDFLVQLNLGN